MGAPRQFSRRLSWSFPRFPQGGGYEVNHLQGGSDHRPVSVEAVLHIATADQVASTSTSSSTLVEPEPSMVRAISEKICNLDDDNDSGGGEGDVLSALGTVVVDSAPVSSIRGVW